MGICSSRSLFSDNLPNRRHESVGRDIPACLDLASCVSIREMDFSPSALRQQLMYIRDVRSGFFRSPVSQRRYKRRRWSSLTTRGVVLDNAANIRFGEVGCVCKISYRIPDKKAKPYF